MQELKEEDFVEKEDGLYFRGHVIINCKVANGYIYGLRPVPSYDVRTSLLPLEFHNSFGVTYKTFQEAVKQFPKLQKFLNAIIECELKYFGIKDETYINVKNIAYKL